VTTDVAVSTPGKLILMGEHAAVYGHPALVAAVDPRMTVSLRLRRDRTVRIELPQLGHEGELDWHAIAERTAAAREKWTRWAEDPLRAAWAVPASDGPSRLVELALGETASWLGMGSGPGLAIRLDSHLPPGAGLGSSAALAVGVAASLLQAVGVGPTEEALTSIALEVERRQHGMPSGVDATAVLRGGILWVEREGSDRLRFERIPARTGTLRRFQVYQSGPPAETTGEVVAAVRKRLSEEPGKIRGALERIRQATEALRRELLLEEGAADLERIRDILRTGEAALEELGVVPDPVRQEIRRIEREGGAAKVSGAGALSGAAAGAVIVYHPDPERAERWESHAAWPPLRLRIGAEGLRPEALR
jgi:mevalonate kinase